MPESYQPGERRAQFGKNHKMSEDRAAWVVCDSGKYMILVGPDNGSGSDIVIHNPRPGKMPDMNIKLSNLTEQELDALEELFMSAFAWARPVVKQRDKEAADAWAEGDDSYTRCYRALPTVVYRKRPKSEYRQGIPERSTGVPEGGGGERSGDSGGVRGTSDFVAYTDEAAGFPKDDSQTAD